MTRLIGHKRVPAKITITGPEREGMKLFGLADKLLTKLDESLVRSPLKLNIGDKTHYLPGGSIIRVKARHDLNGVPVFYGIDITVAGYGIEGIEQYRECYCGCDFAQGVIVGPSEDTTDYPDANRRYDVRVCNKKDRYTLYTYCLPSDHYDYETAATDLGMTSVEGLPVVVFLDNMRPKVGAFACCSTEGQPAETACNPTIGATVPAGEENPVYRIVPVILKSSPRWSEWQTR